MTTNAEASAVDLAELADLVRAEGVPATSAETTRSTQLADTLGLWAVAWRSSSSSPRAWGTTDPEPR